MKINTVISLLKKKKRLFVNIKCFKKLGDYSTIKRNEVLTYFTTWMNLENTV